MKIIQIHITIFLLALLVFSGCYTQYNATSDDVENQAFYAEDGWFEIDGINFYIDYTTRHWFSYYGIDLATDRNFLTMAHFSYHHPTSTYFYSPFRGSMFYSYPGYSNNFFQRSVVSSRSWGNFYSTYHPPYYANQYMWSFYHYRWANWYYWQSVHPSDWQGSYATEGRGYASNSDALRGTSVSGINSGNRSNQVSSRLSSDRNELSSLSSRNRIMAPSIDSVTLNERQQNVKDRRGSDYRSRLGNRSSRSTLGSGPTRSPLSSWSTWEQRNRNSGSVTNRAAVIARTVNRASANRSSESSTVRNTSTNRGSSGGATRSSGSSRSSGEGSSSRGSN
ncbi:MAG: hypothetical protein EA391_10595 [Balneolaceae bacterium]|nr:MAG: hypothetical protein EA391_10595 [Balneolaceae bacterium]